MTLVPLLLTQQPVGQASAGIGLQPTLSEAH
jgi:hypothetical protein